MRSYPSCPNTQLDSQKIALETIFNAPAARWRRPLAALRRLAAAAVRYFSGETPLRIWTYQRRGDTYWGVYDPIDRQRYDFASEDAVRSWLEQRYSR